MECRALSAISHIAVRHRLENANKTYIENRARVIDGKIPCWWSVAFSSWFEPAIEPGAAGHNIFDRYAGVQVFRADDRMV